MSRVNLERVVKHYGSVVALQEMDLEIQEGEFLTLLGPSGCGENDDVASRCRVHRAHPGHDLPR